MIEPTKITIEVCDVCDIRWSKHLELASKRETKLKHFYSWDEREPSLQEYYEASTITAADCIYLLQRVNEGPVGCTGPMGEPGRSFNDV